MACKNCKIFHQANPGEHREFVVVAEEIRKLAEQSTNATKKVNEHIEQIQRDTGETMKAIDGRKAAS